MNSKIAKIATSGMICALYIVILLTGIIPGLIYISIDIAIWSLTLVQKEYGNKYWAACYVACSLLSLMLIPDLEVSLTCICMGWYPLLRSIIHKKKAKTQAIIKTVVFMIASFIIYHISIFVFGVDQVVDPVINIEPFFPLIYAITFTFIFWVLDAIIYILDTGLSTRILTIIHRWR